VSALRLHGICESQHGTCENYRYLDRRHCELLGVTVLEAWQLFGSTLASAARSADIRKGCDEALR
jgi:hypothetical protein